MMRPCLQLALPVFALCITAVAGDGEEGYISRKADTWKLGTAKVERKITLRQGRFFTSSLKNKITGRELLSAGTASEELRALVDGKEVSGTSGGWRLVNASDGTLANGEKQLDLTLRHGDLQATKTYVVYPGTSIIREWVQFRNVGAVSLRISEPQFLSFTAKVAAPGSVKLHWMTGGENKPGAWTLNSEDLKPGELREFDSYDPFGGTAKGNFVGDGVKARVLRGNEQIWPIKNWLDKKWQDILNADAKVPLDVEVEVSAGDQLLFILNRFGTTEADLTAFDPTITYADGETHRASQEFSNEQGKNGWRYQYAYAGTFGDPDLARFYESLPLSHQAEETLHITTGDLVYDDATKLWRDLGDKSADSLFVGASQVHPGLGHDAARVWIAPRSGKVRITATLSNIANQAHPAAFRSYRMGTSSYAPWTALADPDGGGLFVGWDYFGHWVSDFAEAEDGSVSVKFRVAGHNQDLKPGESLTTPMAFVGLFKGDLDDAGNETLDWQYRYLWDYTREGWFGAMRQGGWWWKGTGWPDPRNSRLAGKRPLVLTGLEGSDQESTYRMVFRMADYISEIGADVYHRDFGWWDRMGDWDGPDWKSTGTYLRKHGMGQLIYVPFLVVDPKSKVAREHPEVGGQGHVGCIESSGCRVFDESA